jgi:hypothetical protein
MSPHSRRHRNLIGRIMPLAVIALAGACSSGGDAATSTSTTGTVATTTEALRATSTTSPTTDRPTTTTSTTTSTSTTSTSTTTTLPVIPRQPLTGEVLNDGEEPIARPALAVKIDNAPGARRNHTGLAVADIVYEEIVEGSITRFAAVFHSRGADPVGPIRSGRSQDVDILTPLDHPLFAWSGGNPGVEDLIANSPLIDLNWQRGGQGYYRGPGSIPHNLYNSTDRLWAQTPADSAGAPPEQFEYVRPGNSFDGQPAVGFDLAMRGINVTWTWDAERGQFLRSQQGGAHVDKTYGRIGATNVVVLAAQYLPSQIDARSPEAQTLSEGGPLWVFSGGEVKQGRWIRLEATDPFTFVDENGDPIALNPGNTWVELAEALPGDDPAEPRVDLSVHGTG